LLRLTFYIATKEENKKAEKDQGKKEGPFSMAS